jgi:hypothetical protein
MEKTVFPAEIFHRIFVNVYDDEANIFDSKLLNIRNCFLLNKKLYPVAQKVFYARVELPNKSSTLEKFKRELETPSTIKSTLKGEIITTLTIHISTEASVMELSSNRKKGSSGMRNRDPTSQLISSILTFTTNLKELSVADSCEESWHLVLPHLPRLNTFNRSNLNHATDQRPLLGPTLFSGAFDPSSLVTLRCQRLQFLRNSTFDPIKLSNLTSLFISDCRGSPADWNYYFLPCSTSLKALFINCEDFKSFSAEEIKKFLSPFSQTLERLSLDIGLSKVLLTKRFSNLLPTFTSIKCLVVKGTSSPPEKQFFELFPPQLELISLGPFPFGKALKTLEVQLKKPTWCKNLRKIRIDLDSGIGDEVKTILEARGVHVITLTRWHEDSELTDWV